ncbi:hypothetical protein A9299_10000 [Moraxella osloensis]|uniref:Uncharacterized protein n=1 Tax=Faucicola osloensis TaxID=34062 RepID=A0AA91FJ05_FAUOS|nr:hypothetical protein [Moraxella osloensis]OBX64329.1 hypothetical protein A9299_10000 [Moraxella osloensis]
MKTEQDLAYDRQCREDIAKETAMYLSVQYDHILKYLQEYDTEKAKKLEAIDHSIKFKTLKNKKFNELSDTQLTEFLKVAGEYSKYFRKIKLKIAEKQFANRLGVVHG